MNQRSDTDATSDGQSRRAFLGGLAGACAAGAAGLAGCLSRGDADPRYVLSAEDVGESLADAVRWQPRGRFTDADRTLMDRLVAEGSLATEGFSLYPPAADRPQYVERDGTHYRVTVERTGEVDREEWILWFDLIEGEPPADAEVYTSSLGLGGGTDLAAEYGLSERDVRVVEDAAGAIPTEFGYRDLENEAPAHRGHVFVRRSPGETDLVPDPPFTHVAFETGDGTRYARAVVERTTVSLRRFEYTAEAVADSTAAYETHVRERHLAASFDRAALPDGQRSILDGMTDGRRYEEREPLSDGMASVLDRLGIDDVEPPEPRRVEFSDEVFFAYGGAFYFGQVEVFG